MRALDGLLRVPATSPILLTAPRAETFSIKRVPSPACHGAPTPPRAPGLRPPPPPPLPTQPAQPAYGPEQKEAATAGLPRSDLVPVEPRRRAGLPVALQPVETMKPVVPERHPLHPCAVDVPGIEERHALSALGPGL